MYSLITRRPADAAPALRRFNVLLDDLLGNWPPAFEEAGALTSAWAPACDVVEDAGSVKIVAELPGVKPEEVKVSIENNTLTIRGEKQQVTEDDKAGQVHRYERRYGSFERTFALPSTVDAEKIDARYDNGVLTVELPKVERARPRQIAVKRAGS